MTTYTIKEGENAARPFVLPKPGIGLSIRSAWRIRLGDGTDYELSKNRDQWNKLAGETFNPFNRSENAIMLAWRHVNGVHQITPYYNVKGAIWMPERCPPAVDCEGWPIIQVVQQQDIYFGIHTERSRVTVTIDTGVDRATHRIVHPGTGCWYYEVNCWFGGSEPAPQRMEFHKERLGLTGWERNGSLVNSSRNDN